MTSPRFQVRAGFLPLLDAAILVAAHERGFAEAEGIALTLVRDTSWANIRDRMAVGHFDVAHMLAPMPIAARLGLLPMPLDVVAPMALGLGGNAVTVSESLARTMVEQGWSPGLDAEAAGRALAAAVRSRAARGLDRLTIAVVHPYSGHNYDLRYWLAASGVHPDRDVDIAVLPPPSMPEALASGRLDGFCVGEPWNSVAVEAGVGVIVTSKASIWRSSPEKVLGVDSRFAREQPEALSALLRALHAAARWCGAPSNRTDLAAVLARDAYVGQNADLMMPALTGEVRLGLGAVVSEPDFFMPFVRAATFPWKSHALWFYSQMVRWGHARWSPQNARMAADAFRPDLYRAAFRHSGVSLPAASSKVEGALTHSVPAGSSGGDLMLGPDGFFDGAVFDPEKVEAYVKAQWRLDTADATG